MRRRGLESHPFSVRHSVAIMTSSPPAPWRQGSRGAAMSEKLDDLVSLLALEKIEENLFRGLSQDLGFRQLFGGQVLGQALSAASQTVRSEERRVGKECRTGGGPVE